jgi:hypothetical protein
MGMSLSEIEEKAQELAERLTGTDRSGYADLLRTKLQGLKDLAQIIAFRDRRHEWNSSVGMRSEDRILRERELAAMEQTAANVSRQVLGQRTEAVTAASPPCPSTLTLGDREYYVCTLPAPHDGSHMGGGMSWTGPGNGGKAEVAEPTKPAADRLHELVSYLTATSKRDFDLSKTHTGGSVGSTKHLAASKAYDDAATKLQDILQEGGI